LNKFGGEIDLRTKIEEYMSSYNSDENQKIPIVLIVVGKLT
jgi:hypothetical protein